MALYRKKPLVIEAIQLNFSNWRQVTELLKGVIGPKNPIFFGVASATCGEVGYRGGTDPASKEWLNIKLPTLEGTMIANHGDYIIQGVKGEFYPCKPGIFLSSYDAVPQVYSQDRAPYTVHASGDDFPLGEACPSSKLTDCEACQ